MGLAATLAGLVWRLNAFVSLSSLERRMLLTLHGFVCWLCWTNWCVTISGKTFLPLTPFQSGLHSEACEIDHKLHAIIAGRKRSVLQSIQEETATNIYYPSPLQDLIGPDVNATNSSTGARNSNIIWITGEFFGVQRARDMLYQVSVSKVRVQ